MNSLIEEGGDWDRRNRLKVYQGLYCVAIRDFKQAAELFLDTVSTFTSYELMDYKTFVTYTVYVCMIALKRPDLREKVRSSLQKTVCVKYLSKVRCFFLGGGNRGTVILFNKDTYIWSKVAKIILQTIRFEWIAVLSIHQSIYPFNKKIR